MVILVDKQIPKEVTAFKTTTTKKHGSKREELRISREK